MELYFVATGVYHKLKQFETYMQAIPFKVPYKDKDGKEHFDYYYGMLEPIQLYRYVFPKEELSSVIKTLNLDGGSYSILNTQAAILRKMLKLKPIPKSDDKALPKLLHKDWVAIIGIGIKEDRELKEEDGKTHEAL